MMDGFSGGCSGGGGGGASRVMDGCSGGGGGGGDIWKGIRWSHIAGGGGA